VEGCICTVGRRILVSFDGAVDGLENLRGVFLGFIREGGAWRMLDWGRLEVALGERNASFDMSVNGASSRCRSPSIKLAPAGVAAVWIREPT
jgi:hypothetical protein